MERSVHYTGLAYMHIVANGNGMFSFENACVG